MLSSLTDFPHYYIYTIAGACPGGARDPPPPPLEIELFHLYFATFLVGNIIFSAIF